MKKEFNTNTYNKYESHNNKKMITSLTSGQRSLMRGHIAGWEGADFSMGKVNVRPASREQCSQLQQSR